MKVRKYKVAQRLFEYSWQGGKSNLDELNDLIAEDYTVGAVFDCSDNTFEKGKLVFVLNKNEPGVDYGNYGDDEDEE